MLPDAVLMDIRINGEMDGIETAQRIREFSDAPIIFLTGNSDDGTLERAKLTARSGYLIKPIRQEDLCEAIAQINIQND
jgi:CheY-like chemotaxis protein